METPPTSHISIGILAWNEAGNIQAMLESLFRQSIFQHLAEDGHYCEIIGVANGCTDGTATVTEEFFRAKGRTHRFREVFTCRVADIPERGKANAWNEFVHELSDREAGYLFLADADIVLLHPDTLWNMYSALVDQAGAMVAVDQPARAADEKNGKNLLERISLATAEAARGEGVAMSGRLYCMRAEVARNLYLPRNLVLDGAFIQAVVGTDFLTTPPNPLRIVEAEGAAHAFEVHASPAAIYRSEKRRLIGETVLHVLVEHEHRRPGRATRSRFGRRLKQRDLGDAFWLNRLMAEHIGSTRFFWQLYPGALAFRCNRPANANGAKKLGRWLLAGLFFMITLLACWSAHRFLKQGSQARHWAALKAGKKTQAATGAQPTAGPVWQG